MSPVCAAGQNFDTFHLFFFGMAMVRSGARSCLIVSVAIWTCIGEISSRVVNG